MQKGFSCSRRGSKASGIDELPYALELEPLNREAVAKSRMRSLSGNNPPWTSIIRKYALDYVALLLMVIFLVMSEETVPFTRYIYHVDDQELWRYSYPYHKDSVPSWSVPIIALCSPILVITLYSRIWRASRLEVHNAILGGLSCVIFTALVTNLIKLAVGRPRPNFVALCWPEGDVTWDTNSGLAVCSKNAKNAAEGRKSFPSGHTSWSTSGLGYVTFWLLGKLRLYDGSSHIWKWPVALAPVAGALWIGFTRIQDNWHHWEDVSVGFLLGLGIAYAFYRQHYHGIASTRAGEAFLPILDPQNGDETAQQRQRYNDIEAANFGDDLQQ
ncbi:hypothetical protein CVIRNUC_007644 [Coccomyxa viridis]|uniref:Phosphatidic acid phosphatase type 2/haloperoxidase domain-containing protein n=1 Tax=Coccomyxa viridis TaxID=1274662 RepID=A0AAV1IDW6_9CHLO|nr:hypothetical protein CVIRNUC_007644 [Coccomyxa viridis]